MKASRRRLRTVTLLFAIFAVALPLAAQIDQGPPPADGGLFGSGSGAAKTNVVSVEAQFTAAANGQPGRLFITATIEPGWHIYSISQKKNAKGEGPNATTIEVRPPSGVRVTGDFRSSAAPDKKNEPAFDNLSIETHERTVTWYAPIELATNVDASKLRIRGSIQVQPCDPGSCLPPTQIAFTAALGPGVPLPSVSPLPPGEGLGVRAANPAGTTPVPPDGNKGAFDPAALKIVENDQIQQTPMGWVLLTGFLGGLILNIMPCVLPVIGLKLLSFLEQAGHDRRHALLLNVWYSLGLLAVFVLLATLAVVWGFGWGQLFSYNGFNIALVAVVFAMGLSFLGVWEIPIPGFAGRGKAVELAEKEGFTGAFTKGALTTILATPCTAPFLAPALTWASSQPPHKTYAVFVAVGLGMASPYLLIGAFPKLIAFLPKPGAWMDTFKQIMGFVLLGTVIYLLTFIVQPLVVPTIGFLFGIWGACWWIGRTPPGSDAATAARAWLEAAAFAAAVWIVTFGWLSGVMRSRFDRSVEEVIAGRMVESEGRGKMEVVRGPASPEELAGKNGKHLPWQPFTRKVLEDAVASGATVLVDFTADWCLTCKTLEAAVLNTSDIRDAVQAGGVVTLQADWTHGQPEVTKMLELLGGKQVPVLAIFPAATPNRPIVLRGGYTRQTLLDALKKAGPSKKR
jgi:suppressor for copper-sensitivity B